MVAQTINAFNLPDRLLAKNDAALIGADEEHFAAVSATLEQTILDLEARLRDVRLAPGGIGQEAMDRDLDAHRLQARLRMFRRFSMDLCLGRMIVEGESEPRYIGRFGLTDAAGRRLLMDWRAPAAGPFFSATHANPMGLSSRRRYRWVGGRVSDYWDEVFAGDTGENRAALDDQSAFIASLGTSRSPRMRDVLSTIQADQDEIIRAGSSGALIVDGGPGTGKTVVALHRAAYLLYSDPRLGEGRGGVLFVGPHQPYISYISDVLPSLGEEGVQTCTVRDLVAEGQDAVEEFDSRVAHLKSSLNPTTVIEAAVEYYEEPPHNRMLVETDEGDVLVTPDDWADAFDAVEPGLGHNDGREQAWTELLEILASKLGDGDDHVRAALTQNIQLRRTFNRAWPVLDPAGVVGDLFSVPAYLQLCAPWLTREERELLRRDDARAWTLSDLPLLDAARQRIGDHEESRRRRQRDAVTAAERGRMADVIDVLIAADDDGEGLVTMLRGSDVQNSLDDESVLPELVQDRLAGPFAHVIVDEAQELTDAQWNMLLRRCPSRSFTIVGDRAQSRHGFTESWQERMSRVGITNDSQKSLTVNYRTPEEIMVEAEPVIRAELPDANVPTSIRRSGIEVEHGVTSELSTILEGWLAHHDEGTACVIGHPSFTGSDRVRSLTPELVKGLEFDLVVLIDPHTFGAGIEGAVDRYVAMTRATEKLVVLTSE
ncbi:RNA polymerase recycling motor ATPase HelR [Paramicrobacterium chengjingii]|uniref:AAA family ATPase n=1 Tax=Paramicrobacterium chengjingii TaxID=2769067 RepID=A0ABX6YPN7_9MICO|nr:RNA polymerase recycling motor ATPase HelR [Microbacterium chengjingii]QPZ40247.1 AAA family ATPase [Microbacterium chengjingii]